MSDKIYPIAEIFYSIQGEGAQSGTPMVFVRLAGCTVGKPYTKEEKHTQGLEIFQNKCTSWSGQTFACDTDYRIAMKLSVDEILTTIKQEGGDCKWVSLTGGEPLMHDLQQLVTALCSADYSIHVETSGTIPLTVELNHILNAVDYLVVSPKFPLIPEYKDIADEFRLVVDQDFTWESLPDFLRDAEAFLPTMYISPVNGLKSLTESNMQKCVEIAKAHPLVKVSLQIHKLLGVR